MSPRMGRPKSKNPLNVDIKVRVDQETNDKLVKYAKDHEITRTEVIRRGINLVLEEQKK